MIFSKRKTIGVFICKLFTVFDNAVFAALASEGKRLNYDIVVFTTAGYFLKQSEYDVQEANIFSFAPIEKMDGIIVVPDSYEEDKFRNLLFDMIKTRVHCPVVAIRHESDWLRCVYTDEREAIRPLIRHLIEDHGLSRICFQTGFKGHIESRMRTEAFIEEMKAHGLPVSAESVCPGNMWLNCGEIAFKKFFSNPKEQPEAVVCANDYMALGLIRVLREKGIQVPEDVLVTGFDNIEDAAPELSLTTIEPDYRAMVTEALNSLDRMIRGEKQEKKKIPLRGKLVLGESCGCGRRRPDYFRLACRKKSNEIELINTQNQRMTNLSIDLDGCNDLESIHQVMISSRVMNPAVRDHYLCLFGEQDSLMEENGNRACLVHVIRDHQDCGMPMTSFDRKRLLPLSAERADEAQLFFVKLLHQKGHNFGYSVLQYEEGNVPTSVFVQSNVLLSIALENIRRHEEMMRLYEERRLSSITDLMTGLLNRRGMLEQVTPMWPEMIGRKIAFVCIDMDRLKHINDTYGHAEGDYAIRLVGQAVRAAVSEGEIGARIGGDEFIVFLPSAGNGEAEVFRKRFEAELDRLNRIGKREFTTGASVGYAAIEISENITPEQCMQASDREMYLVKAGRHMERKD